MKKYQYIQLNARDLEWGMAINNVGSESTEAGEEYPNKEHPKSHYFTLDKGRVLPNYVIVYVVEGEGIFQSEHCQPTTVTAGTLFMLFPGEWHNYYPKKETGWTHMWIEFGGENMDRRMQRGFLSIKDPVYHPGVHDDIIELFTKALAMAEQKPENYQIMLAGIVNHLLGIICTYSQSHASPTALQNVNKMNQARMVMLENIQTPLSIQALALRLGMSYSSFRQTFKKHFGESPASYYLTLKIHRAIELLRTTGMPVKEIAMSLGFNSWDNFCTRFKQKTGKRPSDYRC